MTTTVIKARFSNVAWVISVQYFDRFINRVYADPIGVGSTPEAVAVLVSFLLEDGYQEEQHFDAFVAKRFSMDVADQKESTTLYFDRFGNQIKEPPSAGSTIVTASH